jgi:hypothetical protein
MATNTLLNASIITREAIRLWKNTNNLIKVIPHQYDDQFAKTGAKAGTSIRIRLPNDYVVRTGATASAQNSTETNTTLTVATIKGVDVEFSSLERTMNIDDFSDRYLMPMMNNLTGEVALQLMSGVESGACNYVDLQSGGVIIAPTAETWLLGGAKLDENSAPRGDRYRTVVMDPITQARTVHTLSGLFNPSQTISRQFDTGEMLSALGYTWLMDQTTIKHTPATLGGTLTVNGASQTGLTITVNAGMTGGLAKGDIITFAGVFAVNPITKESTGALRQFVVTAAVSAGALTIPIYPALIPLAGGTTKVAYQTVTASPASGAAYAMVSPITTQYRKNIIMHNEAVTLATVDLVMPQGVHEVAREQFDGVSMRFLSDYNSTSDQFLSRLDVLYGYLWIRPEWVCVVADKI